MTLFAALFAMTSASAQNDEAADSLARELREVVVTAKQPATKLVGSTLVSTIAGSNLADLGNALDVLSQLPMISVEDGAVSVVGKNNVEIYIDGRPMRDGQELQQMLSSNMKKVELLMAPGAAYGSATGAVLKITTRRNFVNGLSLTEQAQVRRRRRWSAMDYLGLSYRAGGWEAFVDASINCDNSFTKGMTTNTLDYEGRPATVGSSNNCSYPVTAASVKAGFNYTAGAQSFGAYYRYNPERGDFENNGTEWLDDEPPLPGDISKRTRAHSHLACVYYENTFAGKYLLHFNGDFKSSTARGNTSTEYPDASAEDVRSTDRRHSTLWAGKLYVNFPLWKGDFTAGTQGSRTHTSLDYRMPHDRVGEYLPSALSDARQVSAAAFVSWARMFGRFSLSAGARYEYVDYDFKVDGRRDEDVSRRAHLLTPDVSLGYAFDDDDTQISLSYKMATVKPPYAQLTGALNYTGLHEIEGGNPSLRDERMHDVQLFGSWRGFMLQADYIRSFDTYAFVKQLYPAPDLQLLMHPVNIDVSALSVYLMWSRPVRRWTPSVTAGVYRQWLKLDGRGHDKPMFSYYFDNTFALARGWSLTANVSGSTEGDMHTNRFGRNLFVMNASVGKTLLNKSLTVKISATDIFNTANNDWAMNTCGVRVDKRQSYDGRGVSLSVVYKFRPRRSSYKGASAAEEEMNRL